MKSVELFTPGDKEYARVCAFARTIYEEVHGFELQHFPDTLFAITEGQDIYGCIGLNDSLKFELFTKDKRLQELRLADSPETKWCEQSVLALHQYSMGLPVLIATAAAYACAIGVSKIAYIAVPVSVRTISALGFTTYTYGPPDLSVFKEEEQKLYSVWHSLGMKCSILDTGQSLEICHSTLERFSRRITLGDRLSSILKLETAILKKAA